MEREVICESCGFYFDISDTNTCYARSYCRGDGCKESMRVQLSSKMRVAAAQRAASLALQQHGINPLWTKRELWLHLDHENAWRSWENFMWSNAPWIVS